MRQRFRSTALCVCLALIAGCTPPAQVSIPRGDAQNGVSVRTADLLYVSDLGANSVDYLTYPEGKAAGTLTGFGSVAGLCSDKAGDVFVVDEAGPVDAYAHGGSTPIRKLTTKGAPYGCGVDPTSGDLALTNLSSVLYGTIAIYPHAKGKPRIYEDYAVSTTVFCGYDDAGNLFIDGTNRSGEFVLLELPKGKRGFRTFKLTRRVQNAGGVEWDGRYVAIADRGAGMIYRTTPTGKVAQIVKLQRAPEIEDFWLAGSTLIGPNARSGGTVDVWHYPGGGAPIKTMRDFLDPIGVTLSASGRRMPESAGSADSSRR